MVKPKRNTVAIGGWNPCDVRKWRDLLEHLHEELPAAKPIRVRRTERAAYGYTTDEGTHYYVQIARRLSTDDAVYALEEEWAHCLAGVVGDELADHGMEWGLALSTVRRTILEHRQEETR